MRIPEDVQARIREEEAFRALGARAGAKRA
jgi:hypothetical protein